ncbi:WhiB family transcriptional regulator [Phytoactinopolyspora mesophila]|uniref:Transcriptional regulator WhiB n=1 Tax=Phytoactinopolyspora mesophila TaxID=2650750 RepID=A0A7K3M9R8_9ACTN|nr:WhiB family transcriptional regulator [Phytoactinopolyspora mesophila]NDL60039.1 WhiB family transcriptional regulator [Phytoactinopolyspora mesophila]
MSWARCRKTDPEVFFPIGSVGPALDQIDAAKRICAQCRVDAECLAYALETGQDHGVWGGTTPEERRAMRVLPGR